MELYFTIIHIPRKEVVQDVKWQENDELRRGSSNISKNSVKTQK
jgi:hypothetical protein